MNCSLSGPSTLYVGQSAYWYGSSSPAGYSAYWYGTKNGYWDVYGSYAGNTDFGFYAYYDANSTGSYTRYLVITDYSGNPVCTTNTVYTNVY